MSDEEEIRLIAYKLWEEEGRPEGRDVEHWMRAEAIWREKHQPQPSAVEPKQTGKRRIALRKRARSKDIS